MDGSAIRRARERREVSLAVLAARLHMSPSYLSRIERDERGLTCDTIACASRALGCRDLLECRLFECPVYQKWVRKQNTRRVA